MHGRQLTQAVTADCYCCLPAMCPQGIESSAAAAVGCGGSGGASHPAPLPFAAVGSLHLSPL